MRLRFSLGSGYTAGGLIQRLRRDFPDLECAATAADRAEFRSACGLVQFGIQEWVESHFMLHIVAADFICRCPRAASAAPDADAGTVTVRHQGRIRRTGIEYRVPGRASLAAMGLLQTLEQAAELNAALLPLDFTHCRFQLEPGYVEMRLRHFGACEIVGQLPKFRRYVRLGGKQRDLLLRCIGAFRRIIPDGPM